MSREHIKQALTERRDRKMIKKILTGLLCAALLLSGLATAENVVETLPTTAPMPKPEIEKNEYGFTDLSVFYEGMEDCWNYQMPGFSKTETERLPEAQRRWDEGARPESSILNLTEHVKLSLVELPKEQYEGESWFLLLPYSELTDEELLQVVDAFGQMGIRIDAPMVNWHNCMRGGGCEAGLRSLTEEEEDRFSSIGELYTRSGLRPETPFTALVTDDGLGYVTLDEEEYSGLDMVTFEPARRITDEELLQMYALYFDEPAAAPGKMAEYETQLRKEMSNLLGMPLSAKRTAGEDVWRANEWDAYETDRMIYNTQFGEVGGKERTWSGSIDVDTGKLTSARVTIDDRYYKDSDMYPDVHMDPWDARWEEMARETVASLRIDGEKGIIKVQNQGTYSINRVESAEVRVWMEDGGVYSVTIAFMFEHPVEIEYQDAISYAGQVDIWTDIVNGEMKER